MARRIEILISGALEAKIHISDIFEFLSGIRTEAQNKILTLSEFQKKQLGINVAFLMDGLKEKPLEDVEKVIRIDVRDKINEIKKYEIVRETIINETVEALKKELPGIPDAPEPEEKKKRSWWKLW